jgi:hypothetical protein
MTTRPRWLPLGLATAVALSLLACQERSLTALDGESPNPLLGGVFSGTGLLTCSPLPYDSVTQTIGPEGGTIQVGPHSLSVPAGALDSAVAITAVAPPDTVNRVVFEPSGLVFQQSATLRMSYANCDLLGSTLPKNIAYVDGALSIIYYLFSVDNPPTQTVTGRLDHFSEYAIAW